MAHEITVSVASASDLHDVGVLLAQMRDKAIDTNVLAEQWKTQFEENGDRAVLIARGNSNEPALGMLIVNLVYKLPKIEVRIDEVVVSERARGKGVGTLLMNEAEAWASSKQALVIELTSRPARVAANALYQKLGYQVRETNVYQKKV